MAAPSPSIQGILDKLQSKDKDYRYMATSDLQNELLKPGFSVDEFAERKLATAVLQQLEDVSGDISALAVKCLGLLVRKASLGSVEMLVAQLGTKLTSARKDDERELAGIGLKTAVQELPRGPTAKAAVRKLAPSLIAGISDKDAGGCSASLEVLHDLLARFGALLAGEHARLRDGLLPLLAGARAGVKKRAVHCLGALAPYLNDPLLADTAAPIIAALQAERLKPGDQLSHLQALGALSKASGWRLKGQLDAAIPLVLRYCERAGGEEAAEVKEACLQALEAMVQRAPHEAEPHVPAILQLTLACLAHDPNYADGMEEGSGDGSGDEDDEELSEEEYDDDEDGSWKVRRAAARLLSALVAEFPQLLGSVYPPASSALAGRFREREEAVKLDAFATLADLVRQVGAVSARGDAGPAAALRADVPAILKAASRQLRDRSPKIRAGMFRVLKELVAVLPDATAQQMGLLAPGISAALEDRSSAASALRIQALEFLQLTLAGAAAEAWQAQIRSLSGPVFAAVGDRYYKVSAAALRVCEALVAAIRPTPGAPLQPALQGLVAPLFAALQPRLAAQEQDQEVKEAAISCAAAAIAALGDASGGAYQAQLQVLVERLENDGTRLAAVKALARVAASPLRLPLGPRPPACLPLLLSFLRKADRSLRQASLAAADALLAREESAPAAAQVVPALQPLISDADLLLTAAALNVGSTLLRHHPKAAAKDACSQLLPPALTLAQSPLLQASALEALKSFLIALLHARTRAASYESLLNALLAAGNASGASKAAQANIAACVAALAAAAGPDKAIATVHSLLAVLGGAGGPAAARHLALLSVGEIGRSTDLSGFRELQAALTAALGGDSDELKTAAAHALGAVAVGNLDTYLPFVLQQIQDQAANPKDQYLLLRALSEVLSSLAADGAAQQLPPNSQAEVLQLLLAACSAEEECRAAVAECLGRLALLAPGQTLPSLQQAVASPSDAKRATVVAAVKHALVEQPHPVDAHLQPALPAFLAALSDGDRHVRRAAVQLLGAAAHTKPALVREQLPALLPLLYRQTVVDQGLIRTVDLGPFKHKIDDGLELRKAAFEAMDVLLDAAADRLFLPDFVEHLRLGLEDHYDVKMPCHLLLGKLAARAGGKLLGSLDSLAKPLEKTLTLKLKADAVKQEVDRNEDMLRSCLRAIDACAAIPNVETASGFQALLQGPVAQPPLSLKLEAIRKERADAEGRGAGEL